MQPSGATRCFSHPLFWHTRASQDLGYFAGLDDSIVSRVLKVLKKRCVFTPNQKKVLFVRVVASQSC